MVHSQYLKSICLLCVLYRIGYTLVLLSMLYYIRVAATSDGIPRYRHKGIYIPPKTRNGITHRLYSPRTLINMLRPKLLNISLSFTYLDKTESPQAP